MGQEYYFDWRQKIALVHLVITFPVRVLHISYVPFLHKSCYLYETGGVGEPTLFLLA